MFKKIKYYTSSFVSRIIKFFSGKDSDIGDFNLKLDFVLSHFIEATLVNSITEDMFLRNEHIQDIDEQLRKALLDKIIDDKCINIQVLPGVGQVKMLSASLKGLMINQSGGYSGQFSRENSEKQRNNTIATWVMIGTVGAMLFSGISLIISWRNSSKEKTIVVQIPTERDSITSQNNH